MPDAASLDHRLLVLARTRGHTPRRDRAVAAFSRLGEHAACWLALGLGGAVVDSPRRSRWLRGAGVVAASYALNYAVKLVVRRRRPQLEGLAPLTATVSRLSFPSAHATTSFTAARVYGDLVAPGVLYGVAAAFGLSRPYLGVHYPSDVVAGAVLGTGLAVAAGGGRCR